MHPGFFLPPSEPQSVSPLIWVAHISTLFSILDNFQQALQRNLSKTQKKAHIPNKDIVHFILLFRLRRQDCLSGGHCKIKRGLVHKYILGVCVQCTVQASEVLLRQGGLVVKQHLPILEERRSPWKWPSLMWVTLDNWCRSYICATPAAVWYLSDQGGGEKNSFRALLNSTLTPFPNSGNVVFFTSFYGNIFCAYYTAKSQWWWWLRCLPQTSLDLTCCPGPIHPLSACLLRWHF